MGDIYQSTTLAYVQDFVELDIRIGENPDMGFVKLAMYVVYRSV